ncbi:MAG: hypothetical protein RLZZ511_4113 [Cyanobacteriota bacterium]
MPTKTKTKAKVLNQFADPIGPTYVDPTQIITDAGTQTRPGGTSAEFVSTFADQMAEGQWDWLNYPPCNLFLDKCGSDNPADWRYYPGDGHTRSEAAKIANEPVYAYYREGAARDARRWSLTKANKRQGQGLTKSDLRYQAEQLLRDAEWSKWSSQAIADEVGLSRPTIETLRQSLIEAGEIDDGDRIGLDGKVRKAAASIEGLKIGDWVQGTLITGHGYAEGYLSAIGRKNLTLKRDGKKLAILAHDAQMLCRLPAALEELAPHFGLDRKSLALRILEPDWLEIDLMPQKVKTMAYNGGWSIEYTLKKSGEVDFLGIHHAGIEATIVQTKITGKAPLDKGLAIAMAQAAIDLIISKFEQIPVNPVEAGRIQPVNLPTEPTPPSTDFLGGSTPEATERPSPEPKERQIREVDNAELGKNKERPEVDPAPINTRLRLILGQVEPDELMAIAVEKHSRDELMAGLLRTCESPKHASAIAGEIWDAWEYDHFAEAFDWRQLADLITDTTPAPHLSNRDSWGYLLRGICLSIGAEKFAEILADDVIQAEMARSKSVLGGVAA